MNDQYIRAASKKAQSRRVLINRAHIKRIRPKESELRTPIVHSIRNRVFINLPHPGNSPEEVRNQAP